MKPNRTSAPNAEPGISQVSGGKKDPTEQEWMRALDKKIWPADPNPKSCLIKLESARKLKQPEFEKLTKILDSGRYIVEMFMSSMFGGYGIRIYDHEQYFGTGPEHIMSIIGDHLPGKHEKFPGSGSDYSWEYFSKYTHTEAMKEHCTKYKLRKPEDRYHYDY